ncbi:hypothetical protein [Cupriavidus sp. UYPR2.512]|uniref:hypothetical protein n=1 Tax=Cupriavidus sp. UYPR2.512 TaxID=1080187 RepID=UPI000373AE57|nr:hypothetical protein [Cupriavidus sp. UYPR2.512]UIF90844.1 hypothetical protein KAF44_32160 [Cupriavidus necator]
MSKNPSIGAIPTDASPALRGFLSALKEAVEVRNGQRGDQLDMGVTLRMLQGMDGFTVKLPGQGGIGPGGLPGISIDPDALGDLTPPPALTDLEATGGLASILLTWTQPTYPNHAYTEIWRAEVDDLGLASRVGMTPGKVYADSVGGGRSLYYWVRAVSRANVVGPYNAVAGTQGQTSLDPGYVMDILTGDSTTPFVIQAEPTVINGYLVPAGTYIRDAFIKVGTIGRAMIGLAAIDDARIADLSAEKITAGFIDVARIEAGTITGDKIAANTITADKLVANSITAGQLAAGSVTTDVLAAGAVTAGKVAAGAITADKISVTSLSAISGNLGTITVGTANIADGAITNAKIGNAQVTAAKIADANIGTAKIADAAITYAKIGDAEVNTLKIAGNAVTIPVSGYSAAESTRGSGTFNEASCTITSSGAPIAVFISFSLTATDDIIEVWLDRDGTNIWAENFLDPAGLPWTRVAAVLSDTPGGGSHTYSLMFRSTGATFTSAKRSIVLLETKR